MVTQIPCRQVPIIFSVISSLLSAGLLILEVMYVLVVETYYICRYYTSKYYYLRSAWLLLQQWLGYKLGPWPVLLCAFVCIRIEIMQAPKGLKREKAGGLGNLSPEQLNLEGQLYRGGSWEYSRQFCPYGANTSMLHIWHYHFSV